MQGLDLVSFFDQWLRVLWTLGVFLRGKTFRKVEAKLPQLPINTVSLHRKLQHGRAHLVVDSQVIDSSDVLLTDEALDVVDDSVAAVLHRVFIHVGLVIFRIQDALRSQLSRSMQQDLVVLGNSRRRITHTFGVSGPLLEEYISFSVELFEYTFLVLQNIFIQLGQLANILAHVHGLDQFGAQTETIVEVVPVSLQFPHDTEEYRLALLVLEMYLFLLLHLQLIHFPQIVILDSRLSQFIFFFVVCCANTHTFQLIGAQISAHRIDTFGGFEGRGGFG